MKWLLACATVVVLFTTCLGRSSLVENETVYMTNIIRSLNRPAKQDKLTGTFSWSSCGNASDPLQLNKLSLGPDPIAFPGNITVSFDADVNSNLASPIKLALDLKKKVGFWIKIPCVDNVGSCTYDDLCALIANITCPPPFKEHGIPCNCPIKQGHYTLPTSTFAIQPPSSIPSWLEDGDYEVNAQMSQNGNRIACLNIKLAITKA